jgi:nitroimidazol reductase NimA-like FMN-containing flavoprotein (pyridoxamine 5'-phosphate oxidase superfamily)
MATQSGMSEDVDPSAVLREIIDANQYMTVATADQAGNPWATPVWFATADYREFFWVSSPDARHSRNLTARPEIAIAVFDSRQPPGTSLGAYFSATGRQVPEGDVDRGVAVFSSVSERSGAGTWTRSDVAPPAKHRLFCATTTERFILDSRDQRVRLPEPGGTDPLSIRHDRR